jgi:nicotinamide mononucleotide transporter
MLNWLSNNWIEIFGVISGFIYLILEIKEKTLMWLVGIISSFLFFFVFLDAKLYANLSLQIYYIIIGIYGWYYWKKGNKAKKQVETSSINTKQFLYLSMFSVIVFILYSYILTHYTDSQIPYFDSLTTTLSITASIMLARKILEQWILWIFVDTFSMILYAYQGLYLTSFLFAIFTILAVIGYLQWEKNMKKNTKFA